MKTDKKEIMRAHDYYTQKKYSEALMLYDGLINKMRSFPKVFQKEYAICLQKSMRYKEGALITKNILKSEPEDTDMLLNMCICLGKLGKHKAALVYYNRILKIDRTYITEIGYYAYLLGKTKKLKKADHYYRFALKKEPDNAWYISHYAFFLQEQKKYQEAEVYFKTAMDKEPKNSWVLKRYVYFLYETKGKDAAYSYCDKLIKNDSLNCNIYINSAELAIVLSDADRVLALLNAAEQLENPLVIDVILLFYWTVYYLCNRDYEKVEENVEKLLKKRKEYTGYIHRDFTDLENYISKKNNFYQRIQYHILSDVLRGEKIN